MSARAADDTDQERGAPILGWVFLAGIAAAAFGIWDLSPGPFLAGLFLMAVSCVLLAHVPHT